MSILTGPIVEPLTKENPKQLVIFCHGYGADGNDLIGLSSYFQPILPDAIFLCPNAPEVCVDNPRGYQWFDMRSENEEIMLEKSLAASEKLNTFLDQVANNFQLESSNLALVGFSQGCMISIQTGLQRKEKINCIIGYSGKVINQKHLMKNINSKPKIF